MSNSPSFQPTPVSGPTAVAYYRLPNIPINAYTLLSNLADAIDIANAKLNGHESLLNDINTNAGNAVNNVISNSKGQATDALHSLWGDSQTDLTNAQDQLSAITSARGMGPGPYDFRSILNENASAIQTGLMALENLQKHQDSSGLVPITDQQLVQWKQDVDTLDGSIMNVNMAVEALVMAISSLNNGFAAVCATGLTPGGTLPLFNKNAFAHQANGNPSGGGDKPITEQDLRDEIKAKSAGKNIDPEVIEFLPDVAIEHGLSLDKVKALLDTGVDPQQLYTWIMEDTSYNPKITDEMLTQTTESVKILTARGGDAIESATWLRGLDADQLATLKNRAAQSSKMSVDDLQHLVDPQLDFFANAKHDVPRPGVGPQPINPQAALDNSVSIKSETTTRRIGVDPDTGQIVVIDYTNDGRYHAHVRSWDGREGLTPNMKNALRDDGLITDKGKVIIRDKQGNITGYGKNVIKGK